MTLIEHAIWLVLPSLVLAVQPASHAGPSADEGRALFLKDWLPGRPSAPGGDGLGPVFNETSCVACHNQGGAGGGGPRSRNIDLITAVVTVDRQGEKNAEAQARAENPRWDELERLHAGFRTSPSVMLHRFGIEPDYEAWRLFVLDPRRGVLGQRAKTPALHLLLGLSPVESAVMRSKMSMDRAPSPNPLEFSDFTLFHVQRNPPPLFGAGLMDALPAKALEDAAQARNPNFPEVRGRVCRLADGRVGRFGWKAQIATLEEFVLLACAEELGLDVPGRHQASDPRRPDYQPPGLDLTRAQCDTLIAFVRDLPAPVQHADDPESVAAGQTLFARIGCAACHRARLGTITALYSDLLLHDMGEDLGDNGSYAVTIADPQSRSEKPGEYDRIAPGKAQPATRQEWRTPPLWGLRDSGPYLHDGRAETVEQAIALHGGEAEATMLRFFALTAGERNELVAFLKSLRAPQQAAALGADN